MPGAELKQEEKQGFIDAVPTKPEVGGHKNKVVAFDRLTCFDHLHPDSQPEEEEADEELKGDDDEGEDSEQEQEEQKQEEGDPMAGVVSPKVGRGSYCPPLPLYRAPLCPSSAPHLSPSSRLPSPTYKGAAGRVGDRRPWRRGDAGGCRDRRVLLPGPDGEADGALEEARLPLVRGPSAGA